MRHSLRLGFAVMLCICSASAVHAIPRIISFQGALTDAFDNPITVLTNVEFRIWDMGAGGTELWLETQAVSPDGNGQFSVMLGSINPIPDSAMAAAEAHLGLTISPDPELTPRAQLGAVAYAFKVNSLDGASGGNITSKVSIGVGHNNLGTDAFVAGMSNTASGNFSAIPGGSGNSATGFHSSVSGGQNNESTGDHSTVGGGSGNQSTNSQSTVGGGLGNQATGNHATVGGGNFNGASANNATVSGGAGNIATASGASVGGGGDNEATGLYATIPGGQGNRALGTRSFAAGTVAWAAHDGSFVWGDDGSTTGWASTGPYQFLIQGSGGVAISTESPFNPTTTSTRLTMNGSVGFKNNSVPMFYVYESGASNPRRSVISHSPSFQDWGLAYNDNGDRLVFQSAGNPVLSADLSGRRVGVGVEIPSTILQVVQFSSTDPIADAWTTYSSRRWKDNIQTMDGALEKMLQLRGVTYDWKETGQSDIGLIAEEVGEVFPEIVAYEDNGVDAKSVDYARLVAVLIEANREQQAQIDEQRELIEQLAQRVQMIERP